MTNFHSERSNLWLFFMLALVLSWVFWGIAALMGLQGTKFPGVLFFVAGGTGPMVAALFLLFRGKPELGGLPFWLFLLNPILSSVLFTWIYNNTDRSILSTILFHFSVHSRLFRLVQLGASFVLFGILIWAINQDFHEFLLF